MPLLPMANFVVNDDKRVVKILRRGEDEYRKQYRQMYIHREPITTGERQKDALVYVQEALWNARKGFAPEHNTEYVPRAKFDEIMTPGVVLQIIQQLKSYGDLEPKQQESIAKDIYYGKQLPEGQKESEWSPSCRKLLAALILMGDGSAESLRTLMDDGMSDDCLPLLTRHDVKRSTGELYCDFHSCSHGSINKLGRIKGQFRRMFPMWSQSLMPPFIIWEEKGKHRHYVMNGGGPLPTEPPEDSPDVHNGGFGEVHKVCIDPGDRHFKSDSKGTKRFFALKKLHQNPSVSTLKKEFDLEVRSLIFAESRVNRIPEDGDIETKHHLIQLLATFEVYNTTPDLPTYYLLFPWADGNLEDFWGAEDHRRDPKNDLQLGFMVDQFYYLAKALQCVHNDRQQIAEHTGTDGRRFGRHGDITPKNFLFFRGALDGSNHWLGLRIVLADFGLGRLHSEVSRSKVDPSDVPKTASYAAPEYEVDGRLLSPKSDIFSLGCVFLLYTVWLFDGVEGGLNQFAQQRRKETDVEYGKQWELDNFWVMTETQSAVVKDSVKQRIADLKTRDDCVEVVGEILTIIEDRMLRIEQEERFSAGRLVLELERVRTTWKRKDSLYGSRAWKNSM